MHSNGALEVLLPSYTANFDSYLSKTALGASLVVHKVSKI